MSTNKKTQTTDEILAERVATCSHCGHTGFHVDTTSGEVVECGRLVSIAPPWSTHLLADEDGDLLCVMCAEDAEDDDHGEE